MPKLERKADPPKKKEKATKEGAVAATVTAVHDVAKAAQETAANAISAVKEGVTKKEKKEKKEPKEKASTPEAGAGKKGGKNAPAAEDSGEPVPSMVDLRVGHIIDSKYAGQQIWSSTELVY